MTWSTPIAADPNSLPDHPLLRAAVARGGTPFVSERRLTIPTTVDNPLLAQGRTLAKDAWSRGRFDERMITDLTAAASEDTIATVHTSDGHQGRFTVSNEKAVWETRIVVDEQQYFIPPGCFQRVGGIEIEGEGLAAEGLLFFCDSVVCPNRVTQFAWDSSSLAHSGLFVALQRIQINAESFTIGNALLQAPELDVTADRVVLGDEAAVYTGPIIKGKRVQFNAKSFVWRHGEIETAELTLSVEDSVRIENPLLRGCKTIALRGVAETVKEMLAPQESSGAAGAAASSST